MGADFLQLEFVPLLCGVLVAISCAIPGNFLLLRRQTMLGDAISHTALFGIAFAFTVTGSVASGTMLLGAGAAALLAVLLIEALRRHGRIDPGAATGIVFTSLFALGIILLDQPEARRVHLDVEHALYGNLESLIWLAGTDWSALTNGAALAQMPAQLGRLLAVTLVVVVFHLALFRELTIATFDEAHGRMLGLPVGLLSTLLLALVAGAVVAAFEAVGAIIVIAMLVCPPAAARLCTDSLPRQVALSVAIGIACAIAGFYGALALPAQFGSADAVSAAGMMAIFAGLCVFGAALFGPRRIRAG